MTRTTTTQRVLRAAGRDGRPARTSVDSVEKVGGLDPARQYVVKVRAANTYGTCGYSRAMLGKESCVVDAVGAGTNAVEAASRTAYDRILMDIRLPGMVGKPVSRETQRP